MFRIILHLITFFLLFSVFTIDSAFAQEKEKGKLDDFEKSVKKDPDDKKKNSDSDNDFDDDDDDEEEGFFEAIAVEIFKGVTYFVFVGHRELDSIAYNGNTWAPRYSDYPYAIPNEGLFSSQVGKSFSLKLTSHYFRHNSNLTGFGFRGRIAPTSYLCFDFYYTNLLEKLDTRNDHLHFYDLIINYYRVRMENWTLWFGLGLKGFKGDDTHNGMEFNAGTEIYPFRPFSLHFNYSIGSIEETGVSELLIKLNFHVNRGKLFVGYQRFATGSVTIDGFIGGIGVYF